MLDVLLSKSAHESWGLMTRLVGSRTANPYTMWVHSSDYSTTTNKFLSEREIRTYVLLENSKSRKINPFQTFLASKHLRGEESLTILQKMTCSFRVKPQKKYFCCCLIIDLVSLMFSGRYFPAPGLYHAQLVK